MRATDAGPSNLTYFLAFFDAMPCVFSLGSAKTTSGYRHLTPAASRTCCAGVHKRRRDAQADTPKRTKLAELDCDIERAEHKLRNLVADATSETEANIRAAATSRHLDALRERRGQAAMEIEQTRITAEQRKNLLATATELRQTMATANFEKRRYILDRLDVRASVDQREEECRRLA